MFSATEYYIYNAATASRSYSITKSQVLLPNDSTNHQSNCCKHIYSKNILGAMKMLTIFWEDVIEETVKKCFSKFRISPKDQTNAQNELDDSFFELRSNMDKLKSVGIDEIPEQLTRKNLQISIIPLLQRNLLYLMNQSLQWCMKSRIQSK